MGAEVVVLFAAFMKPSNFFWIQIGFFYGSVYGLHNNIDCCPVQELLNTIAMGRFDFIESAASGYRFFMVEHALIGRMLLFPFVVKLVSFGIVTALELDQNYLRQGLLLLPSYFVEGWLVAQLVRLAIFRETWPAMLSGDRKKDMEVLHVRFRAIMSATIIYVLLKLAVSLISGLLLEASTTYQDPEVTEPSSMMFLMAMLALGFSVWAFRFLWLYIPAALDYPIKDFLYRIRGFRTSLLMLATWVLCFTPLALMFLMASEFFVALFPVEEAGVIPVTYKYAMVVVQAGLEILIAAVSSVAMAYGISSFYQKKS